MYTNPIENQPFYQILFTDKNIGYVIGGSTSCSITNCIPPGGIILKTSDGGNTWSKILEVPNVEFVSIATNNLGDLFAISNGFVGQIFKSTNQGINWSAIESVKNNLYKIYFDNNFGYCTGDSGKILGSKDNGSSWVLANTLTADYVIDIRFNNGNGYCIANNQTVYKTTDNGFNWGKTLNSQNGCFVLNPLTANSCLVFGAGSYNGGCFGAYSCKINQTTDAGSNWTEIDLKEIEPIRHTSFYLKTEGYALAGRNFIKITLK
jgi:photosystem II stability/assembly factor-like uncharacterized protein